MESYAGVRFFDTSSLACEWELQKAESVLQNFNPSEPIDDVNRIIELYNIKLFFEHGLFEGRWDKREEVKYLELSKSFYKIISCFFQKITDDCFISIADQVWTLYRKDFWCLIAKFKAYKNISSAIIMEHLNEEINALPTMLQNNELVRYYGDILAEFMRTSPLTASILIDKYLRGNSKPPYFIPKELKSSEYEKIFDHYMDTEPIGIHDLELLAVANSTSDCPISDKIKLKAKHSIRDYWTKNDKFSHKINYGLQISFVDADEAMKFEVNGRNHILTYDIKWIEDNLDYPTLLNNFVYLFEQFDIQMRSKLPVENYKQEGFAALMTDTAQNHYPVTSTYHYMFEMFNMQMQCYYKILKKSGIQLEAIFKWFFEIYLEEEFRICGYVFNPPSEGSSTLEKCKSISSEMDGVLKQYKLLVEEGEIDRELFEISSGHIIFSDLKSMTESKYAYAASEEIKREMWELFSNQTMLSYLPKITTDYNTLFDLLRHVQPTIMDFEDFQTKNIKWLISRGSLIENENGQIGLEPDRISVLKDLYDCGVFCIQYSGELKELVNQMHQAGDLRYESTLFSEPEQRYLNFMLNKAEYYNGFDLRNKYLHSTYSAKVEEQEHDYAHLLNIMVMVIVKINEELCLKFRQ